MVMKKQTPFHFIREFWTVSYSHMVSDPQFTMGAYHAIIWQWNAINGGAVVREGVFGDLDPNEWDVSE
jgi:hypothetical protein